MSLENLSEEELQEIVENITEEEFDQLDELSKKTLGNYIKRASDDKMTSGFSAGKIQGRDGLKKYLTSNKADKAKKDTVKRSKGINMAVKKMSEDVSDLLGFALDKEPVNFSEKFNEILVNKIEDRVEARKIQVASSLYGESVEEDFDLDDIDIDMDLDSIDEDLDITDDQLQEIVDNITEEEFESLDEDLQEVLEDLLDEANKINKEKSRAFRAGLKRQRVDKMPTKPSKYGPDKIERWDSAEEKKSKIGAVKAKKEAAKDANDKMKLHAREKIRAAGGKSGDVNKMFKAGKDHDQTRSNKDVGSVRGNSRYAQKGDRNPEGVGKHLQNHRRGQIDKNHQHGRDIEREVRNHLDKLTPGYSSFNKVPSERDVADSHSKIKKLKNLHKSITSS